MPTPAEFQSVRATLKNRLSWKRGGGGMLQRLHYSPVLKYILYGKLVKGIMLRAKQKQLEEYLQGISKIFPHQPPGKMGRGRGENGIIICHNLLQFMCRRFAAFKEKLISEVS